MIVKIKFFSIILLLCIFNYIDCSSFKKSIKLSGFESLFKEKTLPILLNDSIMRPLLNIYQSNKLPQKISKKISTTLGIINSQYLDYYPYCKVKIGSSFFYIIYNFAVEDDPIGDKIYYIEFNLIYLDENKSVKSTILLAGTDSETYRLDEVIIEKDYSLKFTIKRFNYEQSTGENIQFLNEVKKSKLILKDYDLVIIDEEW